MKTKMVKGMFRRKIVCLAFLVSLCFAASIVWAEGFIPNTEPEEPQSMMMLESSQMELGIDPNLYSFLVYDCGTDGNLQGSMSEFGISNYTLRNSSSPVTANDLQTHDILIVGWNTGNGTSGLNSDILENGITGRVFLTGHDLDYHTMNGPLGAKTLFSRAIQYVLEGGGTGMIALGDSGTLFSWLPESWEITGYNNSGENVTDFTDDATNSGLYEGLVPYGDNPDIRMSNWGTSYHNTFTSWGPGFASFELTGSQAVTIAAPINPMGFDLQKYDDVAEGNCVNIDDPIEYTIEWHNTTERTFYDAYIKDIFPTGVTYPVEYTFDPNTWEFISLDPGYDEETHTYIYPIGTLDPDDSGILQLDVVVNNLAEPGYYLHNVAELWATVYDPNGQNPVEVLIATAFENTLACCWDTSGILYVDQNATGSNTGVSWDNAYTDLQDALTRARETHCTFDYVIYCAQGVYSPGDNENDSFVLPENIFLYGGFPTGGCDFSLRNPKRYQTTLTGKIDDTHRNNRIVTMGDSTLLDGFTVSEASIDGYGIYGSNVDFTIENCVVEKNEAYGVYAEEGNATFEWCTIRNNKADGIYIQGENAELIVENCWIRQSGKYGIRCINATPIVFNSVITESDLSREGRSGVRMANPTFSPFLLNNTIAHNKSEGISLVGSTLPEIENCIVYHNNSGGPQLAGFTADQAASYSCIADCNEVNNNINDDPEFAYFDPNNVRIMADSPCHDSGLTLQENYSQVDMDNRDRVLGIAVDRGAYEIECEDTVNSYDLNADGLVNMVEFSGLSKAWLGHDPNDPVWLADPNYADPNLSEGWYEWKYKYNFEPTGNSQYSIDLADLITFLEDAPWLWKACWLDLEELQMQQMISGGGESLLALSGTEEVINSSQRSPVLMESSSMGMLAESSVVQPAESVPVEEAVQPEKPIGEQIAELQNSIEFLESLWNQDPTIQQEIDSEGWQEFMEALYQSMADLQTETVQIE